MSDIKLSETDKEVIIAIAGLGETYGTPIRQAVEARLSRPVSIGEIYVSLDNLQAANLIKTKIVNDESRQYKNKRMVDLTVQGMSFYETVYYPKDMLVAGEESLIGSLHVRYIGIHKIQVILTRGADIIFVWTTLPSATPKSSKEKAIFKMEAEYDTGVQYVLDNFEIEPEVIDAR